MNLQCSDIIDIIRSDFGQMWSCSMVGKSLAISSPFMLPNRHALTMYVTMREDRIIVSDGGRASELIRENTDKQPEELDACRDYFMGEHDVSSHQDTSGRLLFYNETKELKLVPSLLFDLGNFVVNFCHAAIPHSQAEEAMETSRFSTKADTYLKTITEKTENRHFQKKLEDLPNASFGAVIADRNFTQLWLVGYVTGSTPYQFNHNLAAAYLNFRFVRKSQKLIQRSSLITLVNNDAAGYRPLSQRDHFAELLDVTGQQPVEWTQKESLVDLIATTGPQLNAWS